LIFVRFTAIADGVVCVQYVDYAKGDTSGFLRMDQSEDAQKLIAAAAAEPEGGLTIAKHLVTFEALEGIPFTLAFALHESHLWFIRLISCYYRF
jgi:hypothetical protein